MSLQSGSKKVLILPVLSVLVILVAWQGAVTLFGIQDFILPAPTTILASLTEQHATLVRNMWVTLIELGVGYGVGVTIGITLAVAMTVLPLLRLCIYPLVVASQTIPKIAVAPLLILWFGVGLMPKVLVVALLAFFPVLVNTVTGLEASNAGQIELMRSIDAGFWQVYRHVRLPTAVPYLFAGLKLALTVSVIGAIVGEWVAGNSGLGYLLVAYNASLRTSDLFAVLVVLVLISSLAFLAITWVEGRFSWEARLNRRTGESVATIAKLGSS